MIITFTADEVRDIMINHIRKIIKEDLVPDFDEDIRVCVDVPEADGHLFIHSGDMVDFKVYL